MNTLLLLCCLVPAQDREVSVEGTVKSVNPRTGEIAILRAGNRETVVRFGRESKVYVDGAPARFADIKQKHEVSCAFFLESKDVTQMVTYVEIDRGTRNRLSGREYVIDGTVARVDPGRREVTILRANRKRTTVVIDKDTNLRIDGRAVPLASIREKQTVRCVFDLDTKRALHLGAFVDIDLPPYRSRR